MTPIPKNTIIQHFTHPKHSLTLLDSNTKLYLCDGCKIPGSGKRYHCRECDFDLHEYCGTCPMNLSSFMHSHPLKLVNRTPSGTRKMDRVCNVCCDSVEGLFYRCEDCDFDVHPLCTQLPESLRHALHQAHPLRLLCSTESGTCAVCRGACNASSWRYRCALCKFDIHLDCVTVQCEKRKNTTDRGIPTYVPPSSGFPPQYFGGYGYGIPYWQPDPSPYFSYPQSQQQQQNYHTGQVQTHYGGGRIGKVMFNLVTTLGIGVFSNMIFGI